VSGSPKKSGQEGKENTKFEMVGEDSLEAVKANFEPNGLSIQLYSVQKQKVDRGGILYAQLYHSNSDQASKVLCESDVSKEEGRIGVLRLSGNVLVPKNLIIKALGARAVTNAAPLSKVSTRQSPFFPISTPTCLYSDANPNPNPNPNLVLSHPIIFLFPPSSCVLCLKKQNSAEADAALNSALQAAAKAKSSAKKASADSGFGGAAAALFGSSKVSKTSTTSANAFFSKAASSSSSSSSGSGSGSKDSDSAARKPKASAKASSSRGGICDDEEEEEGGPAVFGSPSDADFQARAESKHKASQGRRQAAAAAKDEDEEWDDGTNYKPDKAALSLRQKDYGAPQGEGGTHQADVEEAEDTETGTAGETHSAQAEEAPDSPTRTFGAMDNFIDDNKDKTQSQRPKKRKLVERVYTNAKGYMVTEMVEEYVTDDEEEPPAPAAKKKKALPKPAPAPKKKAGAGTQQKGIGSFFGAKK
jgi:hypothetical protein